VKAFRDYLVILIGSIIYAAATVFLVFPNSFSFGGSSGVGLILSEFLPLPAATITAIINVLLMALALIILGRQFAIRTLVGSVCTTGCIALFEYLPFAKSLATRIVPVDLALAVMLIGLASALMFTVNGSSGGTDIVAMILTSKHPAIPVGRALLITDVLIVIATALLMGWQSGITSLIGLIIKSLLIDCIMKILREKRSKPA